MQALIGLLAESPEFGRLTRSLGQRSIPARLQVISEVAPAVLALVARELSRPLMVITPRPEEAQAMCEQAAIWGLGSARLFPESEALPFERLSADDHTTHARISALSALMEPAGKSPPAVFASITAVSQKTTPLQCFKEATDNLARGGRADMEEVLKRWRRMGYIHRPVVDVPGTMGRRGGIIDVFPIGTEHPARMELWGDEIDSIRTFDPATQRSVDLVDSIRVSPAAETLPGFADQEIATAAIDAMDRSNLTQAELERSEREIEHILNGLDLEDVGYYSGVFNTGCVLDYLPAGTIVVLMRPDELAQAAFDTDERADALRGVKEGRGELPGNFPSSHFTWAELEGRLESARPRLELMPWGASNISAELISLPVTSSEGFFGNLGRFSAGVREMAESGARVVAVTSLPGRLSEVLADEGVAAHVRDRVEGIPEPGTVTIVPSTGAGLSAGFVVGSDFGRLHLLSDAEVFGVAKRRRVGRRRAQQRRESLLTEISPGDYVVHIEHGIARFLGTGLPQGGEPGTEYLMLELPWGIACSCLWSIWTGSVPTWLPWIVLQA